MLECMLRMFRQSLLLRLGVAMALITALGFLGMLSSMILAEKTKGEAAAVDMAGSLRMQSFRIATALAELRTGQTDFITVDALRREFNQRLNSQELAGVISSSKDNPLRQRYERIRQRWNQDIAPSLQSDPGTKKQHPYLLAVDDFVHEIDGFVKMLAEDVEFNILLLRIIQTISLFAIIFMVFLTMRLMKHDVVEPLDDLLRCADRVRQGDFSVRTLFQGEDELGQLGQAYNIMAEDLHKMYTNLEQRVQRKTADLQRSNRSLELLYTTARRLSEASLSDETFSQLLRDIETQLGTGPGTLCLKSGDPNRAQTLAITPGLSAKPWKGQCGKGKCSLCLDGQDTRIISLNRHAGDHTRILALPVRNRDKEFGTLLLEIPEDFNLSDWQKRLLETVAGHIAVALDVRNRAQENRRLALFEERNVIARELHDSLAQSLSYLKMTAGRLEADIRNKGADEMLLHEVHEIRSVVSASYQQLRALLTTFRLQISAQGLHEALEKSVAEYNDRGETEISLDNQLNLPANKSCVLGPHKEIHVLQLVREALSNVVKHAKARHAHVQLSSNDNGVVSVCIEDDGIGIPPESNRPNHYGLAIMEERARSLGGRLKIGRRKNGGTRVELTFALDQGDSSTGSSPGSHDQPITAKAI